MKAGKVYIGTSGWMYKGWHKKFYDPKEKEHLKFFSQHFDTVEINNTFYRLPAENVFKKWYTEVGDSFVFAVKLNRYVTHVERLKEKSWPFLERFFQFSSQLGEKLGPILIQLPPMFPYKPERLEPFFEKTREIAKKLGIKPRLACEPRHESWFTKENLPTVLKILKKFKVTPVFAHSNKFPSFDPDTVPPVGFAYIRLHGPEQFAASAYRSRRLKPWAKRIQTWRDRGLDVFFYFNNDVHGYAIEDATTLKKLSEIRDLKK